MKVVRFIYLLLTSTFLLACSVDEDEIGSTHQGTPERIPINWIVESANDPIGSRALIDNNLLEARCTPKSDGTCESIGIWGQYVTTKNGQSTTYVEFDATPLTFAPKTEDTNPHNSWNYPGESRYWENGAVPVFSSRTKTNNFVSVRSITFGQVFLNIVECSDTSFARQISIKVVRTLRRSV